PAACGLNPKFDHVSSASGPPRSEPEAVRKIWNSPLALGQRGHPKRPRHLSPVRKIIRRPGGGGRRMRAEIRAGELLAEMKQRGQRQKAGQASGGNSRTRQPLTMPKLSDLGVTKKIGVADRYSIFAQAAGPDQGHPLIARPGFHDRWSFNGRELGRARWLEAFTF